MRKKLVTISSYCLGGLILVFALAGCGRKGNLYLPENVKPDNEKTITEKTITEKTITEKTITEKTIIEKTIPEKTIPEKTESTQAPSDD